MAIQMGVVITLGAFSGSLLDKYFNTLTPIFTAILSLIAIFLSLYYFLRGFISKK
jgi:F0F1-type ATP synthase assembly protein I|tara:strand:+ start:9144 stop:9308 length:165 start_codon:yes stop_codon:yes gene_type:complete